ncbi:ribosome biogenesis protein BRX1 [Musa troglodytarum]|uniref:Ribosome biogenesis protein BRX1 n=1 Tax=Musa troglodytarum TaxID=320322 RepID=A0A9E7JPR4_9LILI|nr:ribosome biogenesis protein BRX1 [Musa troglodytarum]
MGYGGGERLSSLGTERRSLSRARAAEHIVPHCKKDSKAETKESDGAPLSELIELRNCSSCLFFEIFSIPKDHWKVKPFHDHFFVFPIVDDHIWFRNYQIHALEKKKKAGKYRKKVTAKTEEEDA